LINKVGNIGGIRGIGVKVLGDITLISSATIEGDRWLKERLVRRVRGAVRCGAIPVVGMGL
jgi:hypothetical protein